ncbi:MAG: ferredoxin [Gemmatimonadota bacterium]|nr:ferredoxin [Gemmatimonadota bacterium]
MTDEAFRERRIGELTVRVDRQLCVGFADCVDEAPETFLLDEEGLATFTDAPERADRERLVAACEACPVDALILLDADGEEIVPGDGKRA